MRSGGRHADPDSACFLAWLVAMRELNSLLLTSRRKIMLVLTRKNGQRIRIGEAITITVVRVGHGCVRIGIEAPGEEILREELLDVLHPGRLAGIAISDGIAT
jgi:carbon storage regulator